MTLGETLNLIYDLDDRKCIFARKPWIFTTETMVVPLTEMLQKPPVAFALDLEYFMEVHVAKEVLEVFGENPSTNEDKFRLLVFYAENDAYPDWVFER